jgi:alpha-L-fucosidase
LSTTEKNDECNPKFIPAWNWRSTTAANKIYIEIFTWPSGAFHLDRLPSNVTSAYLLTDKTHKSLKITRSGDGLDVHLPAKVLEPIATVLVLNTN